MTTMAKAELFLLLLIVSSVISRPIHNGLEQVVADKNTPGYMGKGYTIPDSEKERSKETIDQGWAQHQFNQFASDKISLDRPLPDHRDPKCKDVRYNLDELPVASIVICYHNEARSTLLRSVHSVLNRSPPQLIKEIILVDDFSELSELKDLDDYFSRNPEKYLNKVRILHQRKRQGVVGSRLAGLEAVLSPVVIFLDSHIECNEGWLEPLLDRIRIEPSAVVNPIIDSIHYDTFQYSRVDLNQGGFNWSLNFDWKSPNVTIDIDHGWRFIHAVGSVTFSVRNLHINGMDLSLISSTATK